MKRRALERIFLGLLAAAPVALLDGCGPPQSATARCEESPDGHATVTIAEIESAGGIPDDGGAFAVGDGPGYGACGKLCPDSEQLCSIASLSGDTATLVCHADCTGRRPAGLDAASQSSGMFVEMARLEAASVIAFRRLREELRQHGAPRRLLRACSRAARDEIRHARMTGALARRRGERVEAPRIRPASPRSLEAMAIENAVEGCVREMYGALLARRHADAHPDAAVRAAMKRIARDEARHATLAWTIAAWLEPRLVGAARKRVRAARDEAVRELASMLGPAARPAALS